MTLALQIAQRRGDSAVLFFMDLDGLSSAWLDFPGVLAVPGTYTVSLTVSNAVGSDVETKTGYITVTEPGATIELNDQTVDVAVPPQVPTRSE